MSIPLILRALLAAARNRPNAALPIKNLPRSLQPRVAVDPLTGKQIPLTRGPSGQMNPAVREFTADQVRNARLIGAAVPVGVGAAGAGAANIISSKSDAPPSERPVIDVAGMSPEEAAVAKQQAENAIDYARIFSRTPPVTPTERRPSFQRLSQAGALSTNVDPAQAAIGQEVFTPPSDEELLRRRMEAAIGAGAMGQPDESINPSESDIEAALRIARQRALETAYSRENPNRMLSDQNAFRFMEGEPGYTTPGAAGMWSGVDMRAQPVAASSAEKPSTSAPSTSAAAPATAARPTHPMPLAPPADIRPKETTSFMSRLFSGPEYQSTGDRVIKEGGQGVNFGSPESAADFFRAEKALRAQRPEMFERQAEARGGAPKATGGGGKDAALHKALEIIHHMLVRGR
jgi:hypothetical protein